MDHESIAGQAYTDAVSRFLGEDVPHRFLEAERKGLFRRLFGGRAA
jgi:septum site-determining protein MinD